MYCCTLPFLVGVAVAFAGLSYVMYIPIREGVVDTSQARTSATFSRLIGIVGGVTEGLGIANRLTVTRLITNLLMSDNKPPPDTDELKVEDYVFDDIPVRLYRPTKAKNPSPSVIYIHGGGWTILNMDIYDDVVSEFAVRSGYIFISIEYPLAPENPFPIPFDTCVKAALHVFTHAETYGVDPKKIAIAGDSAGGNLAAAVALKLSELKDIPRLSFQWLIYPVTQAFSFKTPSYISNTDAVPYFLSIETMAQFWCNYLGINTPTMTKAFRTNNHTSRKLKQSTYASYVDSQLLPTKYHPSENTGLDYGDEEISNQIEKIILNPYFAPLMAPDLSGVAPAFVVTAEFDVLRDDGLMYAQRMKDAGVDVVVYNSPGSIHGFMMWSGGMPKYADADHTIDMFVKYAKKQFK
ncbi:carboxylesterase NlhH-like [Haliotis rubra]|uniref:carboxylesterase NlhH-like n=1 Tax=Haliotis rubra TaxID=36100 RepID=UPI001EE5C87C|nr:carboxylesterase NlhH-like [Haliotis rubra]